MDKFDRIQQLHRILNTRRYPISTRELAEQLECTEKTIERNLTALRDLHNAPLIRKPRQGWQYTNQGENFELVGTWFTNKELLGLATILSILDSFESKLINEDLSPVTKQIEKLLANKGIPLNSLKNQIKIIPLLKQTSNFNTLNTISHALINEQQVILEYRDYQGNTTNRQISPQRLVHYQENWYIDSYCHLREALRSFKLSRIAAVQTNNKKIKTILIKQLDTHFTSSYGIFSGQAKHQAKLVFYGDVAREVALQQWHPQQQSHWEDNDYHLEIPYNKDQELIRDILKYANNVEVISPAALRKKIINIHSAALHLYTGKRNHT